MQPKFEFLTPDLIARILDEAFQLMQHPGIKIQSSAARQLLVSAGASAVGDIVNIPEGIVRKALDTVPEEFFGTVQKW
jgi:trimethylamine:corrinoid methyltransferase-like protein